MDTAACIVAFNGHLKGSNKQSKLDKNNGFGKIFYAISRKQFILLQQITQFTSKFSNHIVNNISHTDFQFNKWGI